MLTSSVANLRLFVGRLKPFTSLFSDIITRDVTATVADYVPAQARQAASMPTAN